MKLHIAAFTVLIALSTLMLACGVSGPGPSEDDGGSNNEDGSSSSGSSSSGTTGAGGATSSSASTGSGQSTSSSGSTTSSGAGGSTPQGYPSGPFGNQIGDVVQNYSFVDRNGNAVSLDQFYQGDADALVLFGTAAWCGACASSSYTLADDLAAAHPGKAEILGILFEDSSGNPPTSSTAALYMQSKSDAFEFVADPTQQMNELLPGSAIPRLMVIDTSDMSITFKTVGHQEGQVVDAVGAL